MIRQGFTFVKNQVGIFRESDVDLARQPDNAAALNLLYDTIDVVGIYLVRQFTGKTQ